MVSVLLRQVVSEKLKDLMTLLLFRIEMIGPVWQQQQHVPELDLAL